MDELTAGMPAAHVLGAVCFSFSGSGIESQHARGRAGFKGEVTDKRLYLNA